MILLVTTRPAQLKAFAEQLREESRMPMKTAASVQAALEIARQNKVVLAVVDERIEETGGLEVVRHLLVIDAFIHTAVLSAADDQEFHERSEGLGILTRLPLVPERHDARRLYAVLNALMPH